MTRFAAFFLVILLATGCSQNPPKAASAPEKPKAEGDLAFTTLPKNAYNALEGGIKTQIVKIQDAQARLALTGWVMAKQGNEVVVTAPVAGYVRFGDHVPVAGEKVRNGQELVHLEPVLSRLESLQFANLKVGVETDLVKAQISLATAERDLQRMTKLRADGLGSEQDLDQAKKAFNHATEDVKAAKDKLAFFQTPTIKLNAPQSGVVLQLQASPGQYVPAAAPLLTIIDLKTIWVRVPVPEFELPLVDRTQDVEITLKGLPADSDGKPIAFRAKAVGRVPQVDPQKHTADLLYELEDGKYTDRFVKDQMVTAHLPIGRKEKTTIVPTSALVYDAYGHAWLYVERTVDNAAEHKFERRRVESATSAEGGMMVRPSLDEGDRVVIHGAAGLYSREFHKPPVKIVGEKD